MKKINLSLLFLFVSLLAFGQTDSTQVNTPASDIAQIPNVVITKVQADSAYINNDFASAVYMYETLLANEGESADIYYNLGNSYFKMDLHFVLPLLNFCHLTVRYASSSNCYLHGFKFTIRLNCNSRS